MDHAHQPNGERKFILIVEDSFAQATLLRGILEKASFEVALASNGAEALDLLELRLPALIISDVVMPVMDGYSLCQKVKTTARIQAVPFMLLTSLSNPADIFKGLGSGANYYSLKPYDGEKLVERVRSILGSLPGPTDPNQPELNFTYGGQAYSVRAGRDQILDLLLATFENVVNQNNDLRDANQKLSQAVQDNKTLRGLIPICSYCKQVRDDSGYWDQVEIYLAKHSGANFSHGICPRCYNEQIKGLKTPGPRETGDGYHTS
jgi:DNA-binding response OmpR family regulator